MKGSQDSFAFVQFTLTQRAGATEGGVTGGVAMGELIPPLPLPPLPPLPEDVVLIEEPFPFPADGALVE